MKNFLLAGSMMALMGASAFGATIPACTGPSTSFSFLTSAINSDGYTCGDKLFNGISSGAGGTITLTEVNSNLYKFSFTPTNGSTAVGFSLGFTVSLISPSTDLITSFQDQMLTANSTVGANSIPNASTAVVTHTNGGSPNPDNLNALSAQGQTGFVTFGAGVTSTATNFSWTPGTGDTAGTLLSAEFVITETTPSTVPEPMTLSLVGGGLLALGVIGRRRKAL